MSGTWTTSTATNAAESRAELASTVGRTTSQTTRNRNDTPGDHFTSAPAPSAAPLQPHRPRYASRRPSDQKTCRREVESILPVEDAHRPDGQNGREPTAVARVQPPYPGDAQQLKRQHQEPVRRHGGAVAEQSLETEQENSAGRIFGLREPTVDELAPVDPVGRHILIAEYSAAHVGRDDGDAGMRPRSRGSERTAARPGDARRRQAPQSRRRPRDSTSTRDLCRRRAPRRERRAPLHLTGPHAGRTSGHATAARRPVEGVRTVRSARLVRDRSTQKPCPRALSPAAAMRVTITPAGAGAHRRSDRVEGRFALCRQGVSAPPSRSSAFRSGSCSCGSRFGMPTPTPSGTRCGTRTRASSPWRSARSQSSTCCRPCAGGGSPQPRRSPSRASTR